MTHKFYNAFIAQNVAKALNGTVTTEKDEKGITRYVVTEGKEQ